MLTVSVPHSVRGDLGGLGGALHPHAKNSHVPIQHDAKCRWMDSNVPLGHPWSPLIVLTRPNFHRVELEETPSRKNLFVPIICLLASVPHA